MEEDYVRKIIKEERKRIPKPLEEEMFEEDSADIE
jgi:hypothetical protein